MIAGCVYAHSAGQDARRDWKSEPLDDEKVPPVPPAVQRKSGELFKSTVITNTRKPS